MPRGFRIARFISSLETQEERRLRLTTIALAGALALASTITVAQEPEAAESVVQEPEQEPAEPEQVVPALEPEVRTRRWAHAARALPVKRAVCQIAALAGHRVIRLTIQDDG